MLRLETRTKKDGEHQKEPRDFDNLGKNASTKL